MTAANNTIAGYALRQNTRVKSRDELQEKIRDMTSRRDSVTAKARVFRAMERDFESYNKAVRMVMQEAQRGALRNIHGPDYQILIEADYIANASENGYGKESIVHFLDTIMKTASGKHLATSVLGISASNLGCADR